jgi:ribonuclease E
VPPSFPTTSPVAIETARILSAYLSNHKLSPAEAASLGGDIADTLAGLTSGLPSRSRVTREPPPLVPTEEPAPVRQAKPREPRLAASRLEPVAEPEPDAEQEADLAAVADREPEDGPAPAAAPTQPAVAEAADVPRKRKRPSRPRSRRGKGASSATETTPGDAPDHEAPEDEVVAAPPVIEVSREPAAAAENPGVKAKARRTTSRARRVTG